ncbi:hypothetical protein TrRE_jg1686 [Triparma retinervis]|uniref:Uncharacterized protein n=1 Tax=Triparma retinervis TaxID=2557542 RepID=A0A9W7G9E7_9STRA|nr:hypothetical protein TrRE_jg1686 [Triparma retinervis]
MATSEFGSASQPPKETPKEAPIKDADMMEGVSAPASAAVEKVDEESKKVVEEEEKEEEKEVTLSMGVKKSKKRKKTTGRGKK